MTYFLLNGIKWLIIFNSQIKTERSSRRYGIFFVKWYQMTNYI